jgi:hypothetical protein
VPSWRAGVHALGRTVSSTERAIWQPHARRTWFGIALRSPTGRAPRVTNEPDGTGLFAAAFAVERRAFAARDFTEIAFGSR